MHCRILTVGENKTNYLQEGESEYLRRLKHYCPTTIESVKSEKKLPHRAGDDILHREAVSLLARIKTGDYTVALDQKGEMFTSEAFANTISNWQNQGIKSLVFVVGGPLGLGGEVFKRANTVLSLSKMTLMHEMVRLVFLEQFYRAWTILRNEKYHK